MRNTGMAALAFVLPFSILLTGCGGGGGGGPLIDPNSGRITGKISFDGPYDATTPLGVALFFAGTAQEVERISVGKAGSVIQASIEDAGIRYLLSSIFTGSYELVVYKDDGVNPRVDVFRSAPFMPLFNGATATFNTSFSFTGPAPYGSASGTITVTGAWPTGKSVFIGVEPATQPGMVLRWPVAETDLVGGSLAFTVPSMAFGTYQLGLFSADGTGAVTEHGRLSVSTVLSSAAPTVTGQDFAASL